MNKSPDIEMSVYLSNTGTRFKCFRCGLRVVMSARMCVRIEARVLFGWFVVSSGIADESGGGVERGRTHRH